MAKIWVFNKETLEAALQKSYPAPIHVRTGEIDLAAVIRDFLDSPDAEQSKMTMDTKT